MSADTFVRLVAEAGLSHLKLHGLRHMNVSLQLEAGVSETVIAMRVGHTSPTHIRSTYGHLIGTVGQRAAAATAKLVPRKAQIEKDRIKKAKAKTKKAEARKRKTTGGDTELAQAS